MITDANAVILEVNFDLWKEVDSKPYYGLKLLLKKKNYNYDQIVDAIYLHTPVTGSTLTVLRPKDALEMSKNAV